MPGKNGSKGAGRGSTGHGRPTDHGAGNEGEHGRSESSPGHLKKAAGAQSARDYAPGRVEQAGRSKEGDVADRSPLATLLSEVAPDELGER